MPVGYSNKSGQIFNLLRDDLGRAQDMTDYNYEVAYTRGTPGGEYVVNVHMYRGRSVSYPVAVKIVASVKRDPPARPSSSSRRRSSCARRTRSSPPCGSGSTRDGGLVPGSCQQPVQTLRVAAK